MDEDVFKLGQPEDNLEADPPKKSKKKRVKIADLGESVETARGQLKEKDAEEIHVPNAEETLEMADLKERNSLLKRAEAKKSENQDDQFYEGELRNKYRM